MTSPSTTGSSNGSSGNTGPSVSAVTGHHHHHQQQQQHREHREQREQRHRHRPLRRIYPNNEHNQRYPSTSWIRSSLKIIVLCTGSFVFGCLFTAYVVINMRLHLHQNQPQQYDTNGRHRNNDDATATSSALFGVPCRPQQQQSVTDMKAGQRQQHEPNYVTDNTRSNRTDADVPSSLATVLQDLRILVVIVAFDFSQLPHLEEVLNGYHDVCVAGAHVDVIVHATVPYPVTLIDLLNTRISCPHYTITIALKSKSLRLFLVDEHRKVFYSKIHEYDLFIYTEDDIRITPTTVATYVHETQYIQNLLSSVSSDSQQQQQQRQHKPSDFNVGIVRYEYNYPTNVIIDDNTRHATQNVTRVYWEHSSFDRPVVGNAVQAITQEPVFNERYITMKNHHQGMYLATRELLLAWKVRSLTCDFANARPRPGKKGQPTEGTQRVWMSSQMLYGGRHCNVQQVLPKETFGALTVLHLPNKNYRRVGKYRNRQFADGSEVFETPHESLLTAMELHLSVRQNLPSKPQHPYRGIRMVDEVTKERTPLLERRMQEYHDYVSRGGLLSEYDMTKTALVEDEYN